MDDKNRSFARMVFEEKSVGFERLVMLCDGVFAIAMTLLVLDIKLPEGVDLHNTAHFYEGLNEILAKSIFYLLTFATVAGYWVGHRRLMTYVKRQDSIFTFLTFVFLAFVVFFPASFNVVVVGGNLAPVAIFYTLVLAGCGFSSFLLWLYASGKHRLIDPEVSNHEIVTRSIGILISPVYFCLSLLLLLIPNIPAYVAFYSWTFIPLFARLVHVIRSRIEKQPTLITPESVHIVQQEK